MAIERKPSLIRQRFQRTQEIRAFNQNVNDINNQLEKSNFGGSVQEFNKLYDDIKRQNPQLAARLKYNPQNIKNEINNRINTLNDRVKTLKKQIKNTKGSRKKTFKAELSGIQEGINELNKGRLLTVSQVRSYARELRENADKSFKLQAFNDKAKDVSVRIIVDETRFLDSQAEKYLKSSDRNKFREDLTKEYGSRVATAVNEVASLKLDSKKFSMEDVDLIARRLTERDKIKTSSRQTVGDIATFKLTVNTLLDYQNKNAPIKGNFKPLPVAAPLTKFNSELKRLQEFNKNIKEKLNAPIVLKEFKAGTIQNVRNKALTGQTMTPAEKSLYLADLGKRNEKLTKQQLNNVKNFVKAPFNYGKSLVIRSQNGEKNPLFNDLKNFSKGVGQGLKEIFVDPLTGSYNYGKNLVKRGQKQNKNFLQILNQDIKKLTKGIKDTSKFVKDEPIAAGLIVGAAVGQGFKATSKAFKENPAQTLGLAVAYLFPGTIVKTGAKVTGVTKGLGKLRNIKSFNQNKFKVIQDLTTGKFKVLGDIKGKTKITGESFKATYTLNYKPKTKLYTGSIKTTIGKKTNTDKLKFKDEGGFFLDTITKEKFPKSKLPITDRKIKIKETTIEPKKRSTIIQNNQVLFKDESDIKVVLTSILNNQKKVTTRSSNAIKLVDTKTGKLIKGFSNQLSKTSKTTKSKKPVKVNKQEQEAIESFLKSIDYDKDIINGLDRRKRLAIALGLRKDSKVLKSFEKLVAEDGKVKAIFREGKAVLKGTITQGTEPIKKIKLKRPRLSGLRKNKKGSFNVIENGLIETTKSTNKGLVKDFIRIPQIQAKIPLNTQVFKRLNLLSKVNLIQSNLKKIAQLQGKQNIQSQKQIQKLANQVKTAVVQINKKIATQTQKKITTNKKTAQLTTRKTTAKTKLAKAKTPRITKAKTPLLPRIKKKDLDFNKTPPKGFKYKVDGFVNIGKRKVKVVEGLPENKAFNKLFNTGTKKYRGVDNSLAQSFEFRIVGLTKAKDDRVKKGLNKVTKSKQSTKTVLKLKEKKKAVIDTKGEKKGLRFKRKSKK